MTSYLDSLKDKFRQRKFLLKQLIYRDFKSRYKRTMLGVLWSMLSPLMFFSAQVIVFSFLFNKAEHYVTYLIIGNIMFHYFSDGTTQGMFTLSSNAGIISKVKVPKEIFLFSKNISCFVNFLFTLVVMFIIIAVDKIPFHLTFLLIVFPIICLTALNVGMGYILSALYVFFKDIQYLYNICCRLLVYFSAIFYYVSAFPDWVQKMFWLNPLYCYIYYTRSIIIYNQVPSLMVHFLCIIYPLVLIVVGKIIYKTNDNKFAYYL